MKIVKLLCASVLVISILFLPAKVDALVPPLVQFGGIPVLTLPIPCTCSATLWTWFVPLYFTGAVPLTGPMTYVPYATIPFLNFLPTIFLTPHVGAYIPAVPACWVGFPPYCMILPNIGAMAFVGTGLPGGI